MCAIENSILRERLAVLRGENSRIVGFKQNKLSTAVNPDEIFAALQFLYMFLVGSFPFNSFLSGAFCSMGFFVLTGKAAISPPAAGFKQL